MINLASNASKAIGRSLAALVLVAGLHAAPAIATDYAVGTVTAAPYINNVTVPVGSFLDVYNFSLADTSQNLNGAAVSLTLDTMNFHVLNIENFSLSLYDSASNSLLGSWASNPVSFAATLPGGSYHLDAAGTANGLAGGNYTLSIAAAVPEPESYALLLAGLGLVGFAARRRQR